MQKRFAWLLFCCACHFGDNRAAPITGDPPDAGGPSGPIDAAIHEDAPHTPPPPEDAGSATPPPPTCALVPQDGCGSADPACDLTAADDGTLGCRAVTKQGVSNDHCSAATDCKAGYTCTHDADANDEPWCSRFCDVDTDCLGAGSRCVIELDGASNQPLGIDVCSNSCDLVEQTRCASGMACVGYSDAGGDYTDCDYVGTAEIGDACTTALDCEAGTTCVDNECAAYCEVDDDFGCAGDEQCVSFTTPLVIDNVEYGSCQ
jgi:hypothetical protein